MPAVTPYSNRFNVQLTSQAGVRPAVDYGTSVTPGINNAKGSYSAAIFTGSQLNFDAWMLFVAITSNFFATEARDALVDIGYDPAGGTNYQILIPNLLGSVAHNYYGSGISYYFPLHIPAGSQIAARAAVNAANARTLRVYLVAYGKPSRPELLRKGQKVIAYGINAAASAGTALTSGTTAEGAYVSLGSTTQKHFWWQLGAGVNDATMTSNIITFYDLAYGTATNKHFLIEDFNVYGASTSEQWNFGSVPSYSPFKELPSGVELWSRAQCSGTPDTGLSAAAYGVAA